jgi:hypothetical protein
MFHQSVQIIEPHTETELDVGGWNAHVFFNTQDMRCLIILVERQPALDCLGQAAA